MLTLKLKRTKLSTVLTTLDPTLPLSIDTQKDSIKNFTQNLAKVIVSGPLSPGQANGLRHVHSGNLPPLRNLLGSYMVSMPGTEICMLTAPDVKIVADPAALLAYVDSQRMEMAWACHFNQKSFVMSAPVVAHIMTDIPITLNFSQDWEKWVHEWMGRLMRHRYFDGSHFNIIERVKPVETQMISPAELAQVIHQFQAQPKRKKGPLKKVKLPV